ncbi:EamA/RhaT family transporter [uncultured Arcticibacterium sp.]|uniref:EamA/RhaT family transporter n=1 Tax=uncultured Arcticibacterium sp. TaxID=2173042 RepID=UPI0030FCFF00
MIYLLSSILFSVLLLVNFRLFPKFGVNTLHAISLNYIVCFATGMLLMPAGQSFALDLSQNWTWYCLTLGVGFIITFVLSGLSTQKAGITVTSLANNVSLVIPVLVSLLLLETQGKTFDFLNYLGLFLAILAVGIATYQKSEDGLNSSLSSWYLPLGVFLMYGITNAAINYLNLEFIPNPELTIPVTLVMVLGAAIAGLILLSFSLIKNKEAWAWKNALAAISLGVPNFLSFYLLILALTSFGNSGAFVYPIYNIGVIIFSASVAAIFFQEKLNKINKLGFIMAIVALFLISYQELSSLF